MAINVKVNEDKQEEGLDYPLLMISNHDGLIVEMTSYGNGIVVREGKKSVYERNAKSCTWAMDIFKPFHGTIELSNK